MYQRRYISRVVEKQYIGPHRLWRIELQPIKQPPIPPNIRQRTKEPTPLSLQQYIKQRGGLDPNYSHGQWEGEIAMVRDSGKHGVIPGVFNKRAKLTFEEMADECWVEGYLSDPSIDEMLFALSKDIEATLTGQHQHRVYGHSAEDYLTATGYERWESLLPQEDAA